MPNIISNIISYIISLYYLKFIHFGHLVSDMKIYFYLTVVFETPGPCLLYFHFAYIC